MSKPVVELQHRFSVTISEKIKSARSEMESLGNIWIIIPKSMTFFAWDLMVNKYPLTKPYIICRTLHSREGSRIQCSFTLNFNYWADHREFNKNIHVNTEGNPIMTVYVEFFQVSSCILFENFFTNIVNWVLFWFRVFFPIVRLRANAKESLIKSQERWI